MTLRARILAFCMLNPSSMCKKRPHVVIENEIFAPSHFKRFISVATKARLKVLFVVPHSEDAF